MNGKFSFWILVSSLLHDSTHPVLNKAYRSDELVLFPEGGGQPSDSGTFQVINPDGSLEEEQINVREVLRRGLDAIHFCNKPVELGQKVVISLDESRRIDLMSQHTGQHVRVFFRLVLGAIADISTFEHTGSFRGH